jgi:hypothetical protein
MTCGVKGTRNLPILEGRETPEVPDVSSSAGLSAMTGIVAVLALNMVGTSCRTDSRSPSSKAGIGPAAFATIVSPVGDPSTASSAEMPAPSEARLAALKQAMETSCAELPDSADRHRDLAERFSDADEGLAPYPGCQEVAEVISEGLRMNRDCFRNSIAALEFGRLLDRAPTEAVDRQISRLIRDGRYYWRSSRQRLAPLNRRCPGVVQRAYDQNPWPELTALR